MFDGVSQCLTTWATTQGAGAVVFAGDAPHDSTLAARLSLLGILPFPPPRTLTRAPLRFRLRYLVTCPSTTPEAQTLLGRLLVSALQEPELQVELGDIAPEWWSALGCSAVPRNRCTPTPPGTLSWPPGRRTRCTWRPWSTDRCGRCAFSRRGGTPDGRCRCRPPSSRDRPRHRPPPAGLP